MDGTAALSRALGTVCYIFCTTVTDSLMGIGSFNPGPVTVFVRLRIGFGFDCAAGTFPHVVPFADVGQHIIVRLGFGFGFDCAAGTFPHVKPFADIGQLILMGYRIISILTKAAHLINTRPMY